MLLEYEDCRMARPNCRSRATVGVLGCIRRSVKWGDDATSAGCSGAPNVAKLGWLVDGDHGESGKIMSVPDRDVTNLAAIP
ncbi:hypothetical protein AJ87_43100 [Rhizobium yanglingense]|nr:hypothetical protein AJ87_43100 [Rhizobium yanglingense]